MFQEAFEKLELAEIATILDEVNPGFDGAPFDPIETTILALEVPFYPGYRILDIADHRNMPPARRHILYAPKNSVILDFTNAPIYRLNEKLPITLTEDTVIDYLRFFFTYVRGQKGKFVVVESVDDIHWLEDPPPPARKAIGKMIEPVNVQKADAKGNFTLTFCVTFKNALFKTQALIDKKGRVTLGHEQLLIEDMPLIDETIGQ